MIFDAADEFFTILDNGEGVFIRALHGSPAPETGVEPVNTGVTEHVFLEWMSGEDLTANSFFIGSYLDHGETFGGTNFGPDVVATPMETPTVPCEEGTSPDAFFAGFFTNLFDSWFG